MPIVVIIIIVILLIAILQIFLCSTKTKQMIIFFYKDGCIHCKNIKPEWEKFTKMVSSDISIRKINTEENPSLAANFGVSGVPFIVKVNGLRRLEYRGDRTANDLLNFSRQ